jgi:thiamine kinase-like enzyme
MIDPISPDLSDALRRIPLLAGVDRALLRAERLGGLTNRNWRIEHGASRYVLRIPGEKTGDYIDRRVEATNARIAAEAGVNAPVLFFDEADGLMLCGHIDDAVTMSPARFGERPGAPARAALALRRVHRHGRRFAFDFRVFAMIDEYLVVLGRLGAAVPDGYAEAVTDAGRVRAALDARPLPTVPCHCDPLCENFLDDGARMWVVDWEYSGNNDPMWDLGDLSVEAGFDVAQDDAMLAAYFDGAPPAAMRGRMVMYKALCDLLWTLWGLIQHANANPADDFWAYALGRFERCRRLMADPAFGRHLAAVAG